MDNCCNEEDQETYEELMFLDHLQKFAIKTKKLSQQQDT